MLGNGVEPRAARPSTGARPLAVAGVALVASLAAAPFTAATPAWGAGKPAAANRTLRVVAVSGTRAVPIPILAPVALAPAGFVAPSYAAWVTDPARGARTGVMLVIREETVAVLAVDPVAAAPAAVTSAADAPAPPAPAAALSPTIPVPPKRLAEKRPIVLASLVPLPPSRPSNTLAFAPQQQTAASAAFAAADARVPAEAAAEAEIETPPAGEDAARPINDAPEPVATRATADRAPPEIEVLLERHARRFDVPVWLVRRVAWRESKFDPSQRNGPYWGLMQIRVDTARGLGFRGAPKDLLDADTNLSFAVAYLANAYRVAGRDEKRAVMLYARGYYYEAKRKRMLDSLIRTASATPAQTGDAAEPPAP